jgi:hypothetical protein
MTADAALREAYQDWRRLAELEGEAIRSKDWTLMWDCQKRLTDLQPRIVRLTSDARKEWRQAGVDIAQKEKNIRQIISGLIELEMQNSSSLTAAKEMASAKLAQMEQARQNLKRVHRSYSTPHPAVWNSLS